MIIFLIVAQNKNSKLLLKLNISLVNKQNITILKVEKENSTKQYIQRLLLINSEIIIVEHPNFIANKTEERAQ